MRTVNVLQYFSENDFSESLVIKYLYKIDTIILVCAYTGNVLKSLMEGNEPLPFDKRHYHRDLRKLVFEQVTNYRREAGSSKFLQNLKNDYNAGLHKRSVAVRQIKIVPQENSTMLYKANINFGDFGLCTFEFRHFEVEQKLIRSKGKEEESREYEYIDISNKRPIDFFNPFD